jgi:hypothetical protein
MTESSHGSAAEAVACLFTSGERAVDDVAPGATKPGYEVRVLVKRRSRRLLLTTKIEEKAMAPPAIRGLR